jgi:hypothetical protein
MGYRTAQGEDELVYVLQTASGETYLSLKEALVELTLGRSALRILVFHHEDHK